MTSLELERGSGGAGEHPSPLEEESPSVRRSSLVARRSSLVVLAILLLAFALRVWNLTGAPPGLTHDEANHGREAIGILNGVFLYFFPLNYGSEPLYSYTVALSMALVGRGLFALRLVNVIFGMAAIALTYAWAAPRLGRSVALLGAALLAVSFWPLASSREALRAGMLPFFMGAAVWFFWRILETAAERSGSRFQVPGSRAKKPAEKRSSLAPGPWPLVPAFGISIALTLHVYLAARVSWLLFPLFLGYLALIHRDDFRRVWRPALAGLVLGGLLSAPLFLYLRAHPEMQTRLDMLDRPLQAILAGEWRPILANVRDALLAFVWPGRGDQFLAYNIPGRPVFDAVSAVFFVLGLLVCLRRWRRPVFAFLLLWFLTGIIPSLVTGPTANTTRNLAALPAVYLIAAVGFIGPVGWLMGRAGVRASALLLLRPPAPLLSLLALLWLIWVAFTSGRDYFIRWAGSPEVRGAYQHTLVTALAHLKANYADTGPVIFSSVYPGVAHDPSIALVIAADYPALSETARWVDGRYALVAPPEGALLVVPESAPIHPSLAGGLEPVETVEVGVDDLDPSFTIYRSPAGADEALAAGGTPAIRADFDGAAELVSARWLSDARPGETAELLTVWRVLDPARAGPAGPPLFATDAVLFTHVLDGADGLLTQRDSLDAPSWAWRAGNLFAQIHPLAIPAGAAPGEYAAVVGLYDRASEARLPVVGGGDTAAVPPLVVQP